MDAVLGLSRPALAWRWCRAWCSPAGPGCAPPRWPRPGVQRTIGLARRREIVLSHAAQALRETLFTYLRDAARSGELPAEVELAMR